MPVTGTTYTKPKSWLEREEEIQRQKQPEAKPYTPPPELTSYINKVLGKKEAAPIAPSEGQSSLAKIAMDGGSTFQDLASIKPETGHEALASIAAPAPTLRGIPRGQFTTEAQRGYQPSAQTIPSIRLVSESETPEAKGFQAQRERILPEAQKAIESGDPLAILGGYSAKVAMMNPATAFIARGLTEAGSAATAGLPAIINPQGAQAAREIFSTGNPAADWLATEAGGGAGGLAALKVAGGAIEALAPGVDPALKTGLTFGAVGAPANVARTVSDIQQGKNPAEAIGGGLAAESADIIGGALLHGAGGESRPMRAAAQGAIMAGSSAAQSIARGEAPDIGQVVQSAAMGAVFGATGGVGQEQTTNEVNENRAIKAIVGQESGGRSDAVSPTGVKGKYQITDHLTRQLAKKYLGVEKTRDEILGTPEEDIIGQSYIRDLYRENLRKSGGDPDKAMQGLALDYYGRGPHAVGPPPLSYAKQVVKRFRTATGEAVPGLTHPATGAEETTTQAMTTGENGLPLAPRISEGETPAPVKAGDEVTLASGKKANVVAVAKTGEAQLSTGEYVTPDDFAQGKIKNEKAQGFAVPVSGMDTGTETQTVDENVPEKINAAAIRINGETITGNSHAEAIDEAISKGILSRDEDGELIDKEGVSHTRNGDIDLFVTNKGNLLNRFEADEKFGITNAQDIGEQTNATQERQEPENNIEQYQRTTSGQDARQDAGEVRQEEGGQAVGGNRTEPVTQEEIDPLLNRNAYVNKRLAQDLIDNPQTLEQAALGFFANGGSIHPDSYRSEVMPKYGNRQSREERLHASNGLVSKNGTTINAAAHQLWEERPPQLADYDTEDFRNALIDGLQSHGNKTQMRGRLADQHPDVLNAQAMHDMSEQERQIQSISPEVEDFLSFHDEPQNQVSDETMDAMEPYYNPQANTYDWERIDRDMTLSSEDENYKPELQNARNEIESLRSNQGAETSVIDEGISTPESPGFQQETQRRQEIEPKLPRNLSWAKPRYVAGEKAFSLDFESDVDKAAYIAGNSAKKSAHDADYVNFVKEKTGLSEPEVRQYGRQVRTHIKEQTARREGGTHGDPEKINIPKFERPQKPFYESESTIAPKGAARSEIIPGLTDAAGEAERGLNAAGKIRERIAADRAAAETPEETAQSVESKIDYTVPPEHEASPIGIANAQIDAMREKYGLAPRMEAIRVSHPDAYRAAMDRLTENPNAGTDLVESLRQNPKATEPHENILLVRERAFREGAVEEAANDLNAAQTDWERAEAKTRYDGALNNLQKLADVVDRVGTLSGQSLEARKILLNSDDLSLAQMERHYQASVKAGEPLTPEESAKIKTKFDEIQKARKAIDDVQETHANKEASNYIDELVKETARLKEENEKLRNSSGEIFEKLASGEIKPNLWGDRLKSRGQEHVERAKQRLRDIAAGKVPLSASVLPLHPELIKAYTELGVGYLQMGVGNFSNWSKKILADVGDDVRPHLRDIYEAAVGSAKEEVFADSGEELEHGIAGKRTPAQVLADIRAKKDFTKSDIFVLARNHAEAGVRGLNILSEVHKQIKSILPETSLRKVRDVFVDYGKIRYPSADDILKELRKVRSLGQLTSKIEDAMKGVAPKRSGIQRDKPDVEVRTLMKQLQSALRDNNIEIGDPQRELVGKHEARMTRFNNEIEDIERQLRTGERPEAKKPPLEFTPEEKELKSRLDNLRELRKKAFAQSKSEIEAAHLEAAKKALAKRESDLREKYTSQNFEKRKKSEPVTPDAELLRAQYNFKLLKNDWHLEMQRGEAANAPKWSRVLRTATDLRRTGIQISATVYMKLTSAAWQSNFLSAPLEEIASSMLRHLPGISKIAAKAPRWGGGFSMKAEAAALSGFKNGLNDGFRMLVGAIRGEAELDKSIPSYTILYGDKPQFSPGFAKRVAASHSALKEPAKQAEMMRSMIKRLDFAVRNGQDVDDPVVYDQIAKESYSDAKRRIWMNENAFSTGFKQMVHSWAASKKFPNIGPTFAAGAQMEIPVTTVPTNIVADVINRTIGLPIGLGRAAVILAKGVADLPAEKADAVMRQMAKGVPGAAMLTLGLIYHKDIGGFFTKGDKKKKNEPGFGEVKILGETIPKEFFHTADGMTLLLGGTIGRAIDRQKAKDGNIEEAVATGMLGLVQNVPYAHFASNIGKAFESGKTFNQWALGELKGWVEPSAVQYIARKLDSDKEGEPVKRSQENWKEIFEEGLPYLRQMLPKKKSHR